MDYSLYIKKLREKKFLTQEDLARILDVSPITISRWESGKYAPTIKMQKKIYFLLVENKVVKVDR